jgi:uncharacterized protein
VPLRLRLGHHILLYAESLLEELVDVLGWPRLRNKYGLGDDDIKTVLGLILLRGEEVVPRRRIRACRDPKDDKFLEVALAGQADILVSDDEDLLVLNLFDIRPPCAFLEMLDE